MEAKHVMLCLRHADWVQELSLGLFPFIRKMATPPQFRTFPEVTVRIPTGETTRFDRDKPQRRRLDAVSVVKPFYRAWGEDVYTVGLEIKVSKSDLLGDDKLTDYMGFTDFFFLCVPEELAGAAEEKRAGNVHIGVLIAAGERCHIAVRPERQPVTLHNANALYKQLAVMNLR